MTLARSECIPVVTTEAGRCLTAANFQEVGIQCLAFGLDALLMKPGLAYLNTRTKLADYFPWSDSWVLNASMLASHAEGMYEIRSSFDGARTHYSTQTVLDLILHLKPTMVLLPMAFHDVMTEAVWDQLLQRTRVFVPIAEVGLYPSHRVRAIYYHDDNDVVDLSERIKAFPEAEFYVLGAIDPVRLLQLSALGVKWIETDSPAQDAMRGRVYTSEGTLDLLRPENALQFDVIEPDCSCPTCNASLTRAYLHHLIQHTPLLCYRFLVQHNLSRTR